MSIQCVASKRDGSICGSDALVACNNGHVLCVNHAVRLGGPERRRKTDRRCTICRSLKFLTLTEEPVEVERRKSTTEVPVSS